MGWSCPACTFNNSFTASKCGMCLTPKGKNVSQPVVNKFKKPSEVVKTAKKQAGLFSGTGKAVPLQSVSTKCSLKQVIASVELRQEYKNLSDESIDCTYVFPLSEKAAICGFEAEINGRVVRGEVQGKKEARETYETAKASGHGAYLVEQKKENVFEISIGNIPKQTTVFITLKYVTELRYEGSNAIVFSLAPSLIAAAQDKKASNNESMCFTLDMDLNMTSDLVDVTCTSHDSAEIHHEGKKGTVTFKSVAHLTKDFTLSIGVLCMDSPIVMVEVHPEKKTNAVLLSFVPKFENQPVNSELVFVIDRSGSMSGSRMKQAVQTLMNIVKMLPDGVEYNIVSFGNKHEIFFPGQSYIMNDTRRVLGLIHAAGLESNMGGTNILSPLESIFAKQPSEGLARQIMLLTDGEVKNTQEIIKSTRKKSDTTRVFTFGIGRDASVALCQGVARAGGGEAEFCLEASEMGTQVSRQVRRALTPAVTDLKLWWYSLQATQSPYKLRPMFHNDPYTFYALVEDDAKMREIMKEKHEAKMFGRLPNGDRLEICLPIDLTVAEPGNEVHVLAARESIRDLEEGTSRFHTPFPEIYRPALENVFDHHTASLILSYCDDPNQTWPSVDSKIIDAEIKKLGLEHSLASSQTSFVAVEERSEEEKVVAEQQVAMEARQNLSSVPAKNESVEKANTRSPVLRGRRSSLTKSPPRAKSRSSDSRQSFVAKSKKRSKAPARPPAPSSSMSPRMAAPMPAAQGFRGGPPSRRGLLDGIQTTSKLRRAPRKNTKEEEQESVNLSSLSLNLAARRRSVDEEDEADDSDWSDYSSGGDLGGDLEPDAMGIIELNPGALVPPAQPLRPAKRLIPATLKFGKGEKITKDVAIELLKQDLKSLPNGCIVLSDNLAENKLDFVIEITSGEAKTGVVKAQYAFTTPAAFPRDPFKVKDIATGEFVKLKIFNYWKTTYTVSIVCLLLKIRLSSPKARVLAWPPADETIVVEAQIPELRPRPIHIDLPHRPPIHIMRPNVCR